MKIMRVRHVVTLAILLAGLSVTAAAAEPQAPADRSPRQQSLVLDELLLKDGSRLYGAVERETNDEIVFRTQAGAVVTVRREDIARLRRVEGSIVGAEFWRADPNATRLFFAPTGRALPKGEVYVGVFEFLMPFVQVGITDRFSIGGGTPLVFGFGDGWQRPFWVTPKLQVYTGARAQLSVGTFHVFDTGGEGGGLAYAVGTFGGRDASVTLGIGGTYTGFEGGGGVVMAGGERQVARNIKLLTENYVWKGRDGILTGGIRFFGEQLSADIGLAVPMGVGEFVAFPIVNFVYVF
jgi:hypothetical protein